MHGKSSNFPVWVQDYIPWLKYSLVPRLLSPSVVYVAETGPIAY